MVNSECYCNEIIYSLIGQLNEKEIIGAYFQQDGATAHTVSLNFLHEIFSDRLISKQIWPLGYTYSFLFMGSYKRVCLQE